MDIFTIIDLSLLVVFALSIGILLYSKRENLQRSGWLFIYRTEWGIKVINKFGKNHPRLMKSLSYIVVVIGYILMLLMVYMFIKIVWVYIFNSDIVKVMKIPPITPLIPYLPQIFKLTFMPNFYFIYWIIIIALIAIPHEFFHGIFAAFYKVKIKKTGFGFFPFFLPIFTAAFVEIDEKIMQKKENFKQRAILAAGTFANLITALLGIILLFAFFSLSYSPAGVTFDDYAYNVVGVSQITSINGHSFQGPSYDEIVPFLKDAEKNTISVGGETYVGVKGTTSDKKKIALYYDSPAIKEDLYGPIKSIDGKKVTNLESFSELLSHYSPGDNITLVASSVDGNEKEYHLVMAESPDEEGKAWMGIVFVNRKKGVVDKFISFFSSYKKPHVFYKPLYGAAPFIYDFLWWLVIISFSVALINMLPAGIFDGGRFFYLTVLAITRSEKMSKKAFKAMAYIFLVLVIVLMVYWAKGLF